MSLRKKKNKKKAKKEEPDEDDIFLDACIAENKQHETAIQKTSNDVIKLYQERLEKIEMYSKNSDISKVQ